MKAGFMNALRPIKYRKGLRVDPDDWEIMRDVYSLVDPTHEIPKTPRFALSRSNRRISGRTHCDLSNERVSLARSR